MTKEEFNNGIIYLYESCRWYPLPSGYTTDQWYQKMNSIPPETYSSALETILEDNRIKYLDIPVHIQILDAVRKNELALWKKKRGEVEKRKMKQLVSSSEEKKGELNEGQKIIRKIIRSVKNKTWMSLEKELIMEIKDPHLRGIKLKELNRREAEQRERERVKVWGDCKQCFGIGA